MNPHVQLVPHLPPEGQVPTGAGKIPPPAPLDPSHQNTAPLESLPASHIPGPLAAPALSLTPISPDIALQAHPLRPPELSLSVRETKLIWARLQLLKLRRKNTVAIGSQGNHHGQLAPTVPHDPDLEPQYVGPRAAKHVETRTHQQSLHLELQEVGQVVCGEDETAFNKHQVITSSDMNGLVLCHFRAPVDPHVCQTVLHTFVPIVPPALHQSTTAGKDDECCPTNPPLPCMMVRLPTPLMNMEEVSMDNFKPDGQPSSFSVKYELETTAARQIASVAATSIARGQEALEKLYHPVVPPDDKTLELERGLQSIMFGCFKSGTGPVVDGEHPAHLFTKLVGDVSSKDFHLPGRPPDASQLLAWAARKETLQVSTSSGTDRERLLLCLFRAHCLPGAKPEEPTTSPVDKHHSVFHFTRPPDSRARIFSLPTHLPAILSAGPPDSCTPTLPCSSTSPPGHPGPLTTRKTPGHPGPLTTRKRRRGKREIPDLKIIFRV